MRMLGRKGLAACVAVSSLVSGLAGCAQLAGIDNTSGAQPDATPPGTPVSISFERVSIGTTVVSAPLDVSAETAEYLVDDAAAADGIRVVPATVTGAAMDTFTADLTAPTPVLFTSPASDQPFLLDLPAVTIESAITVFEHPAPTPAPADATITVTATSDIVEAGTSAFQLYSVGTWARHGLPAPAVDAMDITTGPLPYSTFTNVYGQPVTDAITTDDAVYVMRYEGNRLAGLLEVAPFAQTAATTITGTLVTVPPTDTLAATFDRDAAAARFAAVTPAPGTPAASFAVLAAPGVSVGVPVGPLLTAGPLPAGTAPGPLGGMFANPFAARGFATVVSVSLIATRTVPIDALGASVMLSASLQQAAVLTPTLALDAAAPLPTSIALDGVPLVTDNVAVAKSAQASTVTFTTESGAATLFQVDLIELTATGTPVAIAQRVVLTAYGDTPSFHVPARYFEGGKYYAIRATTITGGYPSLAMGNLREHTFPFDAATTTSGVFMVTP